MNQTPIFEESYRALTDHPHCFPWQKRAFSVLAAGITPETVTLPTGTGKTSFIALWLIALAWQALQGSITLPRRLVWVVNRRVVVDQATDEAERMLARLADPASVSDQRHRTAISAMASRLACLSFLGSRGNKPVVVSTLRGQLADNGEWKLDPSRPAIIIGTVDMIGSRLLFSGYGDGKYKRPLHAGLLGQDAWLVLDEAHLTPPFSELLTTIRREQLRFPDLVPWRVSLLSATQRIVSADNAFTLTPEDEDNEVIGRRLWAKKALRICELGKDDDELEAIVRLALTHRLERNRVLVFVRFPESVLKLRELLGKVVGANNIRVLTGTQRGFERDALARDPVFAGFRSDPHRRSPPETHYLIATAAGEVGADLDADHLVCDLTALDSLIQRFGRVNRLGMGKARIDLVVVEGKGEKERSFYSTTLVYLKALQVEHGVRGLSPAALVSPPVSAFSDPPATVPLAHHWLDMWSLTSIPPKAWPDRPGVAPWLHGVVEDLPETWVVWRDDIDLLGNPDKVREEDSARVLDAYPVLAQEQLREPTFGKNKIRDKLRTLAQQRDNASMHVILLHTDGSIAWRGRLADMIAAEEKALVRLPFSTVLLPCAAGGLAEADGMFMPRSDYATDVADHGQQRRRFYARVDVDGWEAYPGARAGEVPVYRATTRRDLIVEIARGENLKSFATVPLSEVNEDGRPEDEAGKCLIYFAAVQAADETSARSFVASQPQPLSEHNRLVGAVARAVAEKIAGNEEQEGGLGDLAAVLGIAGQGHDTGKGRTCWQRAIENPDPAKPLAKSGHARFNLRLNGHYRHEFGSLLDAAKAIDETLPHRDLLLHLLASHHGHARPHFVEQAYDRKSALSACQAEALRTVQRFGQLQDRYGRWGLAFLEALLKAADALVSGGHIDGDSP